MMSTDVLLVERDGGVVTLTFNRPDSLNSLNRSLKETLRETLAELDADPRCRAVVLAGAGRAFCVGQDLREHVENLRSADTQPATPGEPAPNDARGPLDTVREHYNPIATRLATLGKPVIAAVRGSAAGAGASLALLADFRIGGPGTSFLMAFARVGLAADTGASWSLPRLVGHAKAVELMLLAQPVPAAEAHRLGLLTRLVDNDDDVLPTAHALAAQLAEGPTIAYGAIKRELFVAESGSLADALAAEHEAQQRAGATADHRAATFAFMAKEQPRYTGT